MTDTCEVCDVILTDRERERYGNRCHSDRPDDEPVVVA